MRSPLGGLSAAATSLSLIASAAAADPLRWEAASPLPDREGFAAPFAGVHNGVLLLAGGANFPGKRPWEGGTKVWYDTVFSLDALKGEWKPAGRLPRPLGYGVSISTSDGVICIGGSDARAHHTAVFRLHWNGAALSITPLPRLPRACANSCGALLGNTIYVAGGIEAPDSTTALHTFWSLDLARPGDGWREEKMWDGPGRMLAVAGVQDGAFYLFGGAGLKRGDDGKPTREWLRDAHCFRPGIGWTRLADLPHAAVAAPSPAPLLQGKLLVLGGDDGAQIHTPPTAHRGFPREILAYAPAANSWERAGELPFSLVTTPALEWNGRIVIPGGEARPGVRSVDVWFAQAVRK